MVVYIIEHMFDIARPGTHICGSPKAAPGAADVLAFASCLSGETDEIDDAARIDLIRALEVVKSTAEGAQAVVTAGFDISQRHHAARRGEPEARQGRGIAHQVALARRESPHRAQRHVGLAKVLTVKMPCTLSALRGGHITDAAELDPASVVARTSRAEGDRCVTIRPAPDTMTWLTGHLPVKEGVAVYAALRAEADRLVGAGDGRNRGQIMADTLRTWIRDGLAADAAQVELRRLFAAPETGQLVAMESKGRYFPKPLADFIELRDRWCRTPWCGAPVRHVDHVTAHGAGGPTSGRNGQGLCEACNHAKQAVGWEAHPRPGPAHEVETTTPTGHRYRSPAPAMTRPRRPQVDLFWAA